jgi:hypothetical protein
VVVDDGDPQGALSHRQHADRERRAHLGAAAGARAADERPTLLLGAFAHRAAAEAGYDVRGHARAVVDDRQHQEAVDVTAVTQQCAAFACRATLVIASLAMPCAAPASCARDEGLGGD